MAGGAFDAMNDEELGERFRSLMRAYDEACKAYEHVRAAEIHREFYVIEDELRRRRGDDNWRRTRLEAMSGEELIERFKKCAIDYDENVDGSDETEHFVWELDDVKKELQRRRGDQRRALFPLYFDADIRVRQAAAEATRTLAPLLSRHRLSNIDDESWQPPGDGLDIEKAGLAPVFPTRAKRPGQLETLSVEQLVDRFVDLALRQDRAELRGEIAKYNRLCDQIRAVEQELRSRDGDQRSALVPLLAHPNAQVRWMAAEFTLAIDLARARRALQEISDRNLYPQAANARLTLSSLDEGRRKPT